MASGTAPYCDPAFTNGYEFTRGSGYALPQYPFTPPPELTGSATTRYPVAIVGAGVVIAGILMNRAEKARIRDEQMALAGDDLPATDPGSPA